MNCEYVDELLPLYTGGDLEEERSRVLAAHLQSCARCAHAADEYAEVKQLWQEFEPPQFSQVVYAGIRRQVLNEIVQKSHAQGWSGVFAQFFAPLLQPRALWVTATLVLATLLAASYFIVHRSSQSTNEQFTADHGGPAPIAGDKNAVVPVKISPPTPVPSSTKGANDSRSEQAMKTGNRHRRSTMVAVARPGNAVFVKPIPTIETAPHVSATSSASAPIRVEMHTKDPNIRIIWLTNQRPQDGPKDPAKGI